MKERTHSSCSIPYSLGACHLRPWSSSSDPSDSISFRACPLRPPIQRATSESTTISSTSSSLDSERTTAARRKRPSTWTSDAMAVDASSISRTAQHDDDPIMLYITKFACKRAHTPPIFPADNLILDSSLSYRSQGSVVDVLYNRPASQVQSSEERAKVVMQDITMGLERNGRRIQHFSPSQPVDQNQDLSRLWEGDIASASSPVESRKALERGRDMLIDNLSDCLDEETPSNDARQGRFKHLAAELHHRYVSLDLHLRLALFRTEKKMAQKLTAKWRKRAVTR